MQNFECIGGPFAGNRLACRFEPCEGAREVVYRLDGTMKVKEEYFYELRRHKTVELITGDGVWQWHYVSPNDTPADATTRKNGLGRAGTKWDGVPGNIPAPGKR